MTTITNFFLAFLLIGSLGFRPTIGGTAPRTPTPDARVQAVLFFSSTCPHCQYVIEEVLPPLYQKYGSQLEILGIDVNRPQGGQLFMAVIEKYKMDSGPVPTLIVGDHLLIGSDQIPAEFPELIESYLSEGGVAWPDIPGLQSILDSLAPKPTPIQTAVPPTSEIAAAATALPPTVTAPAPEAPLPQTTAAPASALSNPSPLPTPGPTLLGAEPLSPWDSWRRDPVGNSFSVFVLIGMLLTLLAAAARFARPAGETNPGYPSPWIPLLCLTGIGVAGYLAYVEAQHTEAFCGPVGDCNAVQQSKYALLFGVLPVGMLGLAGYAAMFIAWWLGRKESSPSATLARLALLAMAAFGLLFSIYLTFLEPFVIGATCAWCLASAILTTVIFWLSLPMGRSAINRVFR